MLKDVRTACIAIVLFTAVFGGLYPLVVTGIAQGLFGAKADGQARLLGTAPPRGPGFFQPRPSATDYSTTATAFSNLGPNGIDTRDAIAANIAAYAKREGVRPDQVPADAAQMSASGIDPDISPANAHLQARRVARERGVPEAQVDKLVDDHTDGRELGFLGERTVNVHDLDQAVAELGR